MERLWLTPEICNGLAMTFQSVFDKILSQFKSQSHTAHCWQECNMTRIISPVTHPCRVSVRPVSFILFILQDWVVSTSLMIVLKPFPVVLQNDHISDHVPIQVRQFQLRSHMEDLLEPDGLCSLTSLAEPKNTGLASPRPALGEWRAAGPPISFPCPSQACQREAKPKTSNLQWLLDRLGLKQCGNYGWQEGRCAVDRMWVPGGIILCQRLKKSHKWTKRK